MLRAVPVWARTRRAARDLEGYPPNMSKRLLLTALEQAELSETDVRAAAMMHIARVLRVLMKLPRSRY